MDDPVHAVRRRVDADADALLAWLVAHPATWLRPGEQLPPELVALASTQLGTAS